MNRIPSWKFLVLLLVGGLLCWMLVHGQGTAIVPPFTTTPFTSAYSSTGTNAGFLLYMRHLSGLYDHFTVGLFSPYNIAIGAATLATYVPEGLSNLMAVPPGPPNVGRGSQIMGGGKFSSTGTLGVAYLTYAATTSVGVAFGSPSLTYTGTTSYPVAPNVSQVITADFNGDSVSRYCSHLSR